MLRRLLAVLSVTGALTLVQASILPEGFEGATRKSVKPAAISDPAVWEEYGLQESEQGVYEKNGVSFTLTAWRLKDPTSALAVWQWLRPPGSAPRTLTWPAMKTQAVETSAELLIQVGNYVLRIQGFKPDEDTLAQLFVALPKVDQSTLPSLTGFLPVHDLISNSERYILGPATLEKFEPRLKPSQVGFHLGAEVQAARYRTQDGEAQLLLISYPTPHIARAKVELLQGIPGAFAKRSGTLVGLILPPVNADAAERVLAGLNWHANITWDENPMRPVENWGDALVSIFILTGILVLVCVSGGILVAGGRMISCRLSGTKGAQDPMILLHLSDR